MNDTPGPHSERDDQVDPTDLKSFDDPDGGSMTAPAFDASVLLHPVVYQRAIIAIAVMLIVFFPRATTTMIGDVAAVALALVGVLTLIRLPKDRWQRIIDAVFSVGLIALAGVFFRYRQSSADALVRLVAVVLVVVTIRQLVLFSLRRVSGTALATAAGSLVAAALLYAFPRPMFQLLLTIVMVVNLGMLVVAIAELSRTPDDKRSGLTTSDVMRDWFRHRAMPTDLRQGLYAQIIFEGDSTSRQLARFFALMGFAAVIASMGVITDSTAVVIGAMLVAPLMTPLMGIAVSLAMGWPNRLQRMAAVALGGVVWAIFIGVILGLALSSFIDLETNSQIQARITPTLLDLLTAVAAGAAGAYGLSRSDVSDSLPGVAIAISLVPPLTVVGICWSVGGFRQGTGALLLFLTNAVAIMLVGALVFVITGMAPIGSQFGSIHRIRNSLTSIAALAAVVLAGLLLNGRELTTRQLQEGTVRSAVRDWLSDDSDFQVQDVNLDDPTVIVIDLVGPDDSSMPSTETLASTIADELDQSVSLSVRLFPVNIETAQAG